MQSITNSKVSEPILRSIFNGINSAIPEGSLTVSGWAETYRYVSAERSANAGKWSNSLVPFLVGVMDAVSNPFIDKVVFMKSSQIAGTEFLNNVLGYFIHIDPSPIMYLAENELKANAWMKECFAPMVRDTPVLRELVADPKERDSSSTINIKTFPGGNIVTAWATSPATLSSRPRRIILADECDAFTPTKEGDPLKLAEARTKTFTNTKKILYCSSPRDKETSSIEPLYEMSDKRKYFVPCPDCGEFQFLKWANVRWDENDAENAFYVCDICGIIIDNSEKQEMLLLGEWRAEMPTKNIAGFWINELYSPFTAWGEMAVDFLASKPFPEQLKVFINTRLAQTWESDGEKVDYADLTFRQEEYDAEIPGGVKVLTAGVDVQDDRLEIEVIGWGDDYESWSIDYKVIYGNPAQNDIWADLKTYLMRDFVCAENKVLKVKAACVDSGGHHTNEVYDFCKANAGRRFFAIKGANVAGRPVVGRPTFAGKQKVRLFLIGTEAAKDTIFANLKLDEAGPGYCHFPANDTYSDAYFKMLCAEKKITKFVGGKSKQIWVKVTANARNEALDCRVYGYAAVKILNPDFSTLNEKRYQKELKPVESVKSTEKPVKPPRKSFVKGGRSGGGFVNSWKK
jgi:phage terminase large subunit GpA-like protein